MRKYIFIATLLLSPLALASPFYSGDGGGGGGGGGGVSGPGSSTDNAVARYDGTGGSTLQNSALICDDSGNLSGVGDAALDSISSDAGTTVTISLGTDAGDNLVCGNNSALVVEGDTDFVGVGTATPTARLHVLGSSPTGIQIDGATTYGFQIESVTGAVDYLRFQSVDRGTATTDTDNILVLRRSGDVGIGTDSPSVDLDIVDATNNSDPSITIGSADAEQLEIQAVYDTTANTLDYALFQTAAASATADKGLFRFNVDGTNIADIDDGGIVLDGDIAVRRSGSTTQNITSTLDGTGTILTFNSLESNKKSVIFKNVHDSGGSSSGDHDFEFEIQGTQVLELGETGLITIPAGNLSVGDNNITNVGDIALDTISSDASTSVTVTLGTDDGDNFIAGNNNALTVEGDTDFVGIGIAEPITTLDVSSGSAAAGFPGISVHRELGAILDGVGLDMTLEDDGGNRTLYGQIWSRINDPTDGSEDGQLCFNVMTAGGSSTGTCTMMYLQGSNLYVGGTLTAISGANMSDSNITNVGDIALDTISADGTNISLVPASGGDFVVTPASNGSVQIHTSDQGINNFTSAGTSLDFIQYAMNVPSFSRFGGIKFYSDDPDFTTETPKLLGGLTMASTEAYAADTDGGSKLEFYTQADNVGAASSPSLVLSLGQDGTASFEDNNITNVGDIALDSISADGTTISITPAAGSDLTVALSGAGDFVVNTDDFFIDTSAGNIGIGTTTPDGDLHLGPGKGQLQLDSSGTYGWRFRPESAATDRMILASYLKDSSTLQTDDIISFEQNGQIGVGIAAPAHRLHTYDDVAGDYVAFFDQDSATGWGVKISGDSTTGADPLLRIDAAAAQIFSVEADGGVFANSLASSTGTNLVITAGNEIVKDTSSLRYKTDVRPIEINTDGLYGIETVSYLRKGLENEGREWGVIAEDVHDAMPELVIYDKEGRPEAVKYDRMALLLIQEMRNLQNRIVELEERLGD